MQDDSPAELLLNKVKAKNSMLQTQARFEEARSLLLEGGP